MHVAGSKHRLADPNAIDILSHDMNFTSTIIFQDEYSVSKTVTPVKAKVPKGKLTHKEVRNPAAASLTNIPEIRSRESDKLKNANGTNGKAIISEDIASPSQSHDTRAIKKLDEGKEPAAGATGLKSSLKTSDSKKGVRSITWADEKTDFDGQNLEEFEEVEGEKGALVTPHSAVEQVGGESYRFESAEACAMALSQAAEAVASGQSDESDAGMELGLNLFYRHNDVTLDLVHLVFIIFNFSI